MLGQYILPVIDTLLFLLLNDLVLVAKFGLFPSRVE